VRNLAIFAILSLAWFRRLVVLRKQSWRRLVSAAKPNATYQSLRNLILEGSREKFGLAPTSRPTEPWAAVMDWGVTQSTATVVALSEERQHLPRHWGRLHWRRSRTYSYNCETDGLGCG